MKSSPRWGGEVYDVAFEDGTDLQPPFLAAGQLGAVGDGPEPQGAPVIHHQLEAAEGGGVVAVFVEQAGAADGLFLGAADGLGRGIGLGAGVMGPEVEGVFGALAVTGQGLGVLLPQGLHALAELLQAGDLVVGQGPGEVLAPALEALEVVGV